jgi:hemerythrin
MLVEWKEAYKLGHPGIDAQHMQLFDLINRMADAATPDELKPLLMQLYRHTREHFELEEGEMKAAGYPGLAAHASYHNELLSRLNRVSQDVGNAAVDRSMLNRLMTEWALRHTQFDDADAAGFIARHRSS